MMIGGVKLADTAGPERDEQVAYAIRNDTFVDWGWIQVPLENDRGYFVVSADYVTLGNDNDWCRMPVGGPAAQLIADYFNALLPTAYMVDLIWRFGTTKLNPQPFKDLTGMTTTKRAIEHNAVIEGQRQGRRGLVVGHKKDLIISNRLQLVPNAVCIYGWHQSNGQPIQPVSTRHDQWWYSDYSHGVRLVNKKMVLDGQMVDVEDVWRNPKLAAVLTGGTSYAARTKQDDAVLRVTRYKPSLLTDKGPYPAPHTQIVPARQPTSPSQATVATLPPSDLGLRALQWCLHELAAGVREEPMGSNAGPRIAEYFKPARRRTTGQLLGIDRGDWCAVAQSAALAAVAQTNEAVPHGYRAAVWELEEDAHESKAWVPAADIRARKYVLRPGDLVLFTRGQPGSRLGHVSRVEIPPDSNGVMTTVGGNEDNAWTRKTRNISDADFRGAIKYRDFARVDFGLPTAPIVQPVQQSLVQNARSTPDQVLTEEGWLRLEEDYLPRVVTGENGRAHPEALKAQAIASRTYLLRAMQDDAALGRTKPISNSQKFQVFAKTPLPACISAVESTQGMVGKYQGRLIIANYVAGSIWKDGRPDQDPTKTEKWVTYNEGKTGTNVQPTRLSSTKRSDNRGCMSQNGADWLGRNGRRFTDILRFFYGADLEISGIERQPSASSRPENGATMNRPPVWSAQTPYAPRVRRPSGIEVLAMSGSGAQTRAPVFAPLYYRGQAPMIAMGADTDQLQTTLSPIYVAYEDMNNKITALFGEDEATRKQWSDYYQGWWIFFHRNWYDTPLREVDAMQTSMKFKEALNGWNNVVAQRMEQNRQTQKGNTYEGKIGSTGFPVVPVLAVAAIVATAAAAAFAGGRA